jgi:spore germination protein KB
MKQIKLAEYGTMIYFLIRASIVGTLVSTILNLSKQDSWISIIIAFFIGFIPLYLFNKIKKIDINENIIGLNNKLGILGKVLNIMMMISVFGFVFMIFWNLINFISTEFLYKTPFFFVSICFMIPIIYASFKDFNVISKMCLISFYIIIIFVFLITAGLIKEVDLSNLMPLFQTNHNNLIKSIFLILVYTVLPIFILLIIPESAVLKNTNKISIIFYVISMLSILNIFIIIIGCFSIELSLLYDYTEFHIFKRFTLGSFLDKVESFLSIEWILGLVLSIIIGINYLKYSFMKMKNSNKFINVFTLFICLILLILVNTTFKNLITFGNFVENYLVFIIFIGLFICPLITFIIYKKRLHKSLIN